MNRYLFAFVLILVSFSVYSQPLQVSVSWTNSCMDDGTATANVSGGVPPYQYLWTRINSTTFLPQFTPTITNLHPGWYYVVITDAAGNTKTSGTKITAPINYYVAVTPDTCGQGSGTAYCELLSGTNPPLTHLWSDGSVNDTSYGHSIGYLPVTVTITDANGCFLNSMDADSTQNAPAYNHTYIGYVPSFEIDLTLTDANCNDGTAAVALTGGIAPFSYSWNTIPVQNTPSVNNLSSLTIYEVTVTDATGCTGTRVFEVQQGNSSNLTGTFSTTPDSCYTGTGTVTCSGVGGVPPYTYQWSTGQNTATVTGLNGGFWGVVTITDNIGCRTRVYPSVLHYSPVSVSLSALSSSCSIPTGSITANTSGGTPPYSYSWNTIPAQNTATASSLTPGLYMVLVTDQSGCTRNATTFLVDTSSLSLNSVVTSLDTCNSGTGSALINVAGGQAPYTYLWNTIPAITTPSASGLSYGSYVVTVTDAAGCTRKEIVNIGSVTTITLTGAITDASCIYNADGQISATPLNGVPPYTYSWSNGANTPVISGLLPDYYSLYVTDASGCSASRYFKVEYDSIFPCATEIKGQVFSDFNSNCIYDLGERPNVLVNVQLNPGNEYRFTDLNGEFAFIKPLAGNYDLDMNVPVWYNWNCGPRPANINTTLGATTVRNLPIQGNAVDMVVSAACVVPPVPGFDFRYQVSYRNQGSIDAPYQVLKVNYDPALSYISSNPAPITINSVAGELFYNADASVGTLLHQILITFYVPPSMAIGNQLAFYDSIFTSVTDTVLLNNYFTLHETVVGPFDPNDIQVSPKGAGTPGYIGLADSVLTYTVRFQNTGNYPAQNVVVKILGDSDLDLSSLEFLGASFDPQISIDANGLITFSFIGIYLADSVMNEPESHGYLMFSVKQKPNLQELTEISLSADIYFDFNAPVTTNSTLNTITSINNPEETSAGILLFPSPATDMINVQFPEGDFADYYILSDITGRTLAQKAITGNNSLIQVDTRTIPPGMYLISFYSEMKPVTVRFIRQ